MLPAQLDYIAPQTVEDAIAALANPDVTFAAGNHQQVIDLKMRRLSPRTLVDLRKIAALYGVSAEPTGVRIGSMTTLNTIMQNDQVKQSYPALAEAAAKSGDPQMRNMDSIGGSLTYNPAVSDVAAALLALNAIIEVAGTHGNRAVSAAEFFAAGNTTTLAPGEIVTAVVLPTAAGHSGYEKLKHPAHLGPVCGVAAYVALAENGTVAECRLGVTGAADQPSRLTAIEAALTGQSLTAEVIAQAAAQGAAGLSFVSDLHYSAQYRAHLVTVLAKRVLMRLQR